MRKSRACHSKTGCSSSQPKFTLLVIASILTFFVPIFVLPGILDNVFNAPKPSSFSLAFA